MTKKKGPGTVDAVHGANHKKAEKNLSTQITKIRTPRQKIKQRIISAACQGFIPIPWAEWLIASLGLCHD